MRLYPQLEFSRARSNDQTDDLRAGRQPAWIGTIRRAIKLLSSKLPEPVQDRSWFSHVSNLREALSAETFADFCERAALLLGPPQAIWQMCSEDSILGSQLLDRQQQLLLDQPADVGQNPCP
jgi:hypothetical protein